MPAAANCASLQLRTVAPADANCACSCNLFPLRSCTLCPLRSCRLCPLRCCRLRFPGAARCAFLGLHAAPHSLQPQAAPPCSCRRRLRLPACLQLQAAPANCSRSCTLRLPAARSPRCRLAAAPPTPRHWQAPTPLLQTAPTAADCTWLPWLQLQTPPTPRTASNWLRARPQLQATPCTHGRRPTQTAPM